MDLRRVQHCTECCTCTPRTQWTCGTYEADAGAAASARDMQACVLGDASDCGLGQVAQREQHIPQGISPHRGKEVRLILVPVDSTQQLHSTCDQASLLLSSPLLKICSSHRRKLHPGSVGIQAGMASCGMCSQQVHG